MTNTGPPHARGGQLTPKPLPGEPAPNTILRAGQATGPPPGAELATFRRPEAGNMGMTADGGHTVTGCPGAAPAAPGWGDQAVVAIYRRHYGSLVRQAALLVRDTPTAEDVVQDCFIAMHLTCPRLEDAKALPYLRRSVMNRSRSVLRHRVVVDRHGPESGPDMPSAEDGALIRLEHAAMISALAILAPRQRQVLALRYFADMSEAQIAAALGISKSAVKTHASRGLTSLRPVLESRTLGRSDAAVTRTAVTVPQSAVGARLSSGDVSGAPGSALVGSIRHAE
jgi:RNA polymerase sigma-70 factor (sigma-E family)